MAPKIVKFLRRTKSAKADMRPHDSTGKSLSEALIFASTDPQYDNRLLFNYKFNA